MKILTKIKWKIVWVYSWIGWNLGLTSGKPVILWTEEDGEEWASLSEMDRQWDEMDYTDYPENDW